MMKQKFYPYTRPDIPFPSTLDDTGQAKKLKEFAGNNICCVEGIGFCAFNGTFWEPNQNCVENAAMALSEYQLQILKSLDDKSMEAMKLSGALDSNVDKKALVAFIKKNRSASGISNVAKVFKTQTKTKASEDMDSDPYLICTPDGVYDLRKGMDGGRPAEAKDFMTLCTKVAPGDEGKKLWLEALNSATNEDTAMIDFIQVIAGLGLIGEVRHQLATLVWGPSGSAKSSLFNPMTAVLGSYAINLHADILLSNKISDNTVMSERAMLRKKRWALCSEVDEGVLNEGSLKKLVSTDTIKGRLLYQTAIQFEPTHSLYCYLNTLPTLDTYSDAVRNRLLIIPFTTVVAKEKKVFNYGKVLLEKAGPAILAWLIEGAKKIIELDFKIDGLIPPAVTNIMNSYFAKQDWLTEFLDSVCKYGEEESVNAGQIYDVYISYCKSKNKRPVTTGNFAELMKNRFEYESKRVSENGKRTKNSVYKGISLDMLNPQVRKYLNYQ